MKFEKVLDLQYMYQIIRIWIRFQKYFGSIVYGLSSVWTSHQVTIIDFPNATYRWSSHSQSAVAVASTTLMPWAATTATTPLATLKRNCLWSFCLCTVKFIASKTEFVQVSICFCSSHSRFLAWVPLSIEAHAEKKTSVK